MRFIYKNITENTQILTLLNDEKTQVTSIPLGAGARVEVANSSLDIYVPHILSRIDEAGYDISHSIVMAAASDARNAEAAKSEAAKAALEAAPVDPAPQTPAPTPVVVPEDKKSPKVK